MGIENAFTTTIPTGNALPDGFFSLLDGALEAPCLATMRNGNAAPPTPNGIGAKSTS